MASTTATCRADALYDDLRERKVCILKGMDCYTEFKDGLPIAKRLLVSTNNPSAMRLDEWANETYVSVSGLIELIDNASYIYEREPTTTEKDGTKWT